MRRIGAEIAADLRWMIFYRDIASVPILPIDFKGFIKCSVWEFANCSGRELSPESFGDFKSIAFIYLKWLKHNRPIFDDNNLSIIKRAKKEMIKTEKASFYLQDCSKEIFPKISLISGH